MIKDSYQAVITDRDQAMIRGSKLAVIRDCDPIYDQILWSSCDQAVIEIWSGCYQRLWWEFDQAVIRDCDQALMRLWSGWDHAVIRYHYQRLWSGCDQEVSTDCNQAVTTLCMLWSHCDQAMIMLLIRVWLGCDHVLISLWSDGDQMVIRCDQILWWEIVIRYCDHQTVINCWSGSDQAMNRDCDQTVILIMLWSCFDQAVIRCG